MNQENNRPDEYKILVNPYFCAVVMRDFVDGYFFESKVGLPFPLVYLFLPIILRGNIRNLIPNTIATKLLPWLHKYPQVKIDFAKRTKSMVPFTNEALIVGTSTKILTISKYGEIFSGETKVKSPVQSSIEIDVLDCRKKSLFMGRWFAKSGSPSTIFSNWGIRP